MIRMQRCAVVLVTLAASGTLAVGLASSAQAHVTVNSTDATQGGYAVLTFRVPTESDTASTTGLKIKLPTDHPIASVSVQPHPGWSFKTKTAKLRTPLTTDDGKVTVAVSEIDWTADSAATAIKPGEFDQFAISAGPLPEADSLTFKALQRYSDGTTVAWIEEPAPGSDAEPEHPAPSIELSKASDPAPSTSASVIAASHPNRHPAAQSSYDGPSKTTVTIAVVLGALGAALALVALVLTMSRRRRSPQLGDRSSR